MQTRVSAYRQVALLVRLKYKLNRLDFSRLSGTGFKWGAWLRLAVPASLALGVSFRIHSDLVAIRVLPDGLTQAVAWLTLYLNGLLLYLLLAPFSIFRTARNLEIQGLCLFPSSFPVLFSGRCLAALLDPEIMLSLLPMIAIAAAFGFDLSLLPISLLLMLFFVTAVILGQGLYTLVEVAYQDRRFRELLFTLFVTLACLGFGLLVLIGTPEQDRTIETWRAGLIAFSTWWPSHWTAYAVGNVSQGNHIGGIGVSLALLLSSAVLIWLSSQGLEYLYYRRGYLHNSEGGRTNLRSPRLGFLERILSRETKAIFIKELLLFRRSPWWFLFFVTWPLMVISVAWVIPVLRDPPMIVIMAFACLGALDTLQAINWLGAESKALSMLFVLPVTPRALVLGKNLRVLVTMFVEMLIGFAAYLVMIGRLYELPHMLLFNLSTVLIVLSMVNLFSVHAPQKVSSFEFLPRMPMSTFLGCVIGSLTGGLPIFALVWLGSNHPSYLTAASVLSLVYGLLFYQIDVALVAHYLEGMRKDIYLQLTQAA